MQLSVDEINKKILLIRGQKVMLDRDLAVFYGVETKVLNQAVKRNIERFPDDFMFQLSKEEFENWKSQFVTSNSDKMGLRRAPYVFTEHGISMLSAVLKSKTAVDISIQIMRTFVEMRRYALNHEELAKKIDTLEQRVIEGEEVDKRIIEVLNSLMSEDKSEVEKIGFVK